MRNEMKAVFCFVLMLSMVNLSVAQTALGAGTPHQAAGHAMVRKAPAKSSVVHHVIYTNNRYGFRFYLPSSWKGYSIIESEWDGSAQSEGIHDEGGPHIVIRHPLWTEDNPREDIPIMVFTHKQWREVDRGNIIVSPAPIGPCPIGANKRYVFALPPRYNYDLADGWEEVVKILQRRPLRAYDSAKSSRTHPLCAGLK